MAAKGPGMGGEFSPQEDRRKKVKKGHQQHSIVNVSLLGEGKKITSSRLGEQEVCVSAPEGSYSAYPEGVSSKPIARSKRNHELCGSFTPDKGMEEDRVRALEAELRFCLML